MSPGEQSSFPLTGQLLDGRATFEWVRAGIATSERVTICSAYLRSEALEHLCRGIQFGAAGRVLVRWRLADLTSGASNFEAFSLVKAWGWDFYVRLDFHGKVYCLPPKGIIVGSANATLSGLGAASRSNSEVCTLVECTTPNLAAVDDLFAGATHLTIEMYKRLLAAAEQAGGAIGLSGDWPDEIAAMLNGKRHVKKLFVSECLLSPSPALISESPDHLTQVVRHDLALLGFSGGAELAPSTIDLRAGLKQTAIYGWLVEALRASSEEAYFGKLTADLHSALLDDPGPSRMEVKSLLQNLLSWIDALGVEEIQIDRPNHSQRVRYQASN